MGQSSPMTIESKERAKKKQWSDFSPAAKLAIVVGGIAELVVTTIALRDIIRRPSSRVRGPKLLWVLSFFIQPVGAPLYLVMGRRKSSH